MPRYQIAAKTDRVSRPWCVLISCKYRCGPAGAGDILEFKACKGAIRPDAKLWKQIWKQELVDGKDVLDTGGMSVDNLTFGVSMVVVGMGGTLLTLWILSLLMALLKKIFPYKANDEAKRD
jgi:hypothetical protein